MIRQFLCPIHTDFPPSAEHSTGTCIAGSLPSIICQIIRIKLLVYLKIWCDVSAMEYIVWGTFKNTAGICSLCRQTPHIKPRHWYSRAIQFHSLVLKSYSELFLKHGELGCRTDLLQGMGKITLEYFKAVRELLIFEVRIFI